MAQMSDREFLQYYTQNASHIMWFLGAGASRTAGLPTATDITWDLKRKFYCLSENQDIQGHDINNSAIRNKIQSYMESKGFPSLWDASEYSFYFELLFRDNYASQQKYLSDTLSTKKVSLTVGHRVLAALQESGLARVVFTTNFDEVVELAYASVVGNTLSTFHLEVSVSGFYVQQMKTKWGSCNATARTIRLNTELAKKPKECIEYIVVHEMIHLIEPTHGPRFIALMDRFMPAWRETRALLNRLPARHERWNY